jgi:HlyD family secretion protein
MKNIIISILFLTGYILSSCSSDKLKSDAYGNFEANDVLISSEVGGKLLELNINEGEILDSGFVAARIDSVQNYLKLKQLIAQREVVVSKLSNIQSQIAVQKEQLKALQIEKNRLVKLLADGAANQRQLDDVIGKVEVVEKTILSIGTQNEGVRSELKAFDMQIEQIEDNLKKYVVKIPMRATVLEKFAENYELVMPGKALFKIADLSSILLKAYVSGNQLSEIKIGMLVKVIADSTKGKLKEYSGRISWISEEAEFTPKIIQTREERVNLVYAVKIDVKNDGSLKIGMPGEVVFRVND